MGFMSTLAIAFGLAMDAFAVSIVSGMAIEKVTHKHVLRLSLSFGFFQFLMPIIGWLAGMSLAVYIELWDHWLAFGMLAFVGGKMLWEARSAAVHETTQDPTKGWTLIVLSIATSIDALAVGLSMALIGVSVWLPSIIIGLIAAGMTVLGMTFGNRFGDKCGKWAEVVGGLVLLGIGFNILITHLME